MSYADINLIYGDHMKYFPHMEDNKYDLIIADPSYGINVANMAYTQESKQEVKQKNGRYLKIKNYTPYNRSDWDIHSPSDDFFKEIFRVSTR